MNTEEKNEISSVRVFHPSKFEGYSDSGPWKGYDGEDIYLLFSIIYRAIFKENIFSSNLTKKEILIDGENKEYHLQKHNKIIKIIKDSVLKRIVNLENFKLVVVEIFQDKYPKIVSSQLDTEAIIENILKNFKSIGDKHKVESEAGEEKATDEETDMVEYESSLKELYKQLTAAKEKIKSIEKHINDLPQRIIGNFATKINHGHKNTKSDLTIKNLMEANRKEEEKTQTIKRDVEEASTNAISRKNRSGKDDSVYMEDHKANNKLSKDSGNSSNNSGNGSYDSHENEEFEEIHGDKVLNGDIFEKEIYSTQEKSKLPKAATDILRDWFLKNIDNPYPTAETKEKLCEATGLNKKQIQNWFTNSRKRYLEPLRRKIENLENDKLPNLQMQQNNVPELTQDSMQQNRVQQQQGNIQEPFKEHLNVPPIFEPQNPTQVYQKILQPQNAIIPSQPIILRAPGGVIPQNGYYYVNAPTMYPQIIQQPPPFQPNGIRAPNGQILVPAGIIAQPQPTPIILSPPPQGPYLMVNRPAPNYMPVGMLPINGTYVVPVQNYPYLDPKMIPNNQVPILQNGVEMRSIYPQTFPIDIKTFDVQQNNLINKPLVQQGLGNPIPINPQMRENIPQHTGMMNHVQTNSVKEDEFPKVSLKPLSLDDERRDSTEAEWILFKRSGSNQAETIEKPAPEKKVHKDDEEAPINALRQYQQK